MNSSPAASEGNRASDSELQLLLHSGVCSYTIPSGAVRACCQDTVRFTTRQKAALVYNNSLLDEATRLSIYRELIRLSHDEQDLLTETQLIQRLQCEELLHQLFFHPDEASGQEPSDPAGAPLPYCYAYRISAPEWSRDVYGYFSTWQKADAAAREEIRKFLEKPVCYSLMKFYIDSDRQITFHFSSEGTPLSGCSLNCPELDAFMDQADRFEDMFIQIPYPFRRGDFIRTIGDEQIGVFGLHRDEAEYQEHQAWIQSRLEEGKCRLDVSDMSTRVEYFDPESGRFWHAHPPIVMTEYAEVDACTDHHEILEAASDLMKGKGSIECLEYCLEKNAKK